MFIILLMVIDDQNNDCSKICTYIELARFTIHKMILNPLFTGAPDIFY